jgi:hypothetical protein
MRICLPFGTGIDWTVAHGQIRSHVITKAQIFRGTTPLYTYWFRFKIGNDILGDFKSGGMTSFEYHMTGSCLYSLRMTGTEVGGIAPNSVTMSVTKSAGMASYTRFSRPAHTKPILFSAGAAVCFCQNPQTLYTKGPREYSFRSAAAKFGTGSQTAR